MSECIVYRGFCILHFAFSIVFMRALFLDIASHTGLLACVQDDGVRSIRMIDQRIRDHELVMLAEESLAEAGWQYRDLTHVACVTGPGGFTSLRVAVAFANTLAHELDIPSIGIHLSDVYAARVSHLPLDLAPPPALRATLPQRGRKQGEVSFLWLHSTKKRELFVRGFGTLEHLWSKPIHISLEELGKQLPSSFEWVGELIPEHEEFVRNCGGKALSVRLLIEVLPEFVSRLSYGGAPLEPWYGRGW